MLVDMNAVTQCMVVSSAFLLSSPHKPQCTPTAERLSVRVRGYLRRVIGIVMPLMIANGSILISHKTLGRIESNPERYEIKQTLCSVECFCINNAWRFIFFQFSTL
jgi:hypothetical protein